MPTGVWLYSYCALWLLVLLECLALVMLVRQLGGLYAHWIRNDPDWGLPLGSLAPLLPDTDLYGRSVSLAAARGRKTVLFFLSPGCRSCKEAIERVRTVADDDAVEVVLIVRASELPTRLFLSERHRDTEFPDVPVLADPENRVADQYKVVVVPYIVVTDTKGRIAAKGSVITLAEIGNLLNQADRSQLLARRHPGSPVLAADGIDAAS